MFIEVVCQALSLAITMDVTGVMGLASLISSGREAKEMYDSYKGFEFETRQIAAQREATRVLLQQWSENVGYGQSCLKDDHHKLLDDPSVHKAVDNTFQCLQDMIAGQDSKPTDPSLSSREQSEQSRQGHLQMDKSQTPMSRNPSSNGLSRTRRKFMTRCSLLRLCCAIYMN